MTHFPPHSWMSRRSWYATHDWVNLFIWLNFQQQISRRRKFVCSVIFICKKLDTPSVELRGVKEELRNTTRTVFMDTHFFVCVWRKNKRTRDSDALRDFDRFCSLLSSSYSLLKWRRKYAKFTILAHKQTHVHKQLWSARCHCARTLKKSLAFCFEKHERWCYSRIINS